MTIFFSAVYTAAAYAEFTLGYLDESRSVLGVHQLVSLPGCKLDL